MHWTRAPVSSAFPEAYEAVINDVVRFRGGFIAVGFITKDPVTGKGPLDTDAAVWRSDDGLQWTRVPQTDAFGGKRVEVEGHAYDGDQIMASVAASGSRLVVVGIESFLGQRQPAVWASSDGSEWARVAQPLAGEPPSDAAMLSVAQLEGRFVAVGTAGVDPDARGGVWISEDGLTWKMHDSLGGDGSLSLTSVIGGPFGFLAVGTDDMLDKNGSVVRSKPVVFLSRDGQDWSRIGNQAEALTSGAMTAVAEAPTGIVAVGRDATGASASEAAVWSSEKGSAWRRVRELSGLAGPGEQSLTAVASWPGGLVVGGSANGAPAVWIAEDGGVWQQALLTEAREDPTPIQAIVVGQNQILVVGSLADANGISHPAFWVAQLP